MKKASIISAMLMAPVLFAQEPQAPIVHTPEGPVQVFSETRVFVNGKELSPEEVTELKKQGVLRICINAAPMPTAPITQEGGRVFIHGHELPPEIAAHMIESGIVGDLQAPVHKTQTITPVERPEIETTCCFAPEAAKPIGGRVFIHGGPEPGPGTPDDKCGAPEAPACEAPQVSMKVYINGQEVDVPAHQSVHVAHSSHGVTVNLPKPPACGMPKPFCGQPCNCGPAPKPCNCTPDNKCGPTNPPATEAPACELPEVSMKVYINGQEVDVPMPKRVHVVHCSAANKADRPKPFCGQPCNCGPAPKPCTCTPDNKCGPTNTPACDTKPAEPDTPVLPTPALPAAEEKPACPVQNAAVKVIINDKEVEIPAGKMMRLTTDADGQITIVPVD